MKAVQGNNSRCCSINQGSGSQLLLTAEAAAASGKTLKDGAFVPSNGQVFPAEVPIGLPINIGDMFTDNEGKYRKFTQNDSNKVPGGIILPDNPTGNPNMSSVLTNSLSSPLGPSTFV